MSSDTVDSCIRIPRVSQYRTSQRDIEGTAVLLMTLSIVFDVTR
jgi:hypothetical protein